MTALAPNRSPIRRAIDLARTRGLTFVLPALVDRLAVHGRRRRPPTLPSRLDSELRRLIDPRPPLHVLHVGKTGGTALKHVLLEHEKRARYRLLLHGHDVTVAHIPDGERFMFILRDPVARFVSAFNGRARQDHPRYRYPWREDERAAFALFRTPHALAEALSSEDSGERKRARRAMHSIAHVNTPYRHWFGDVSSFRGRLSDVFFIAFQEHLDGDFALLKEQLGLPEDAALPIDPVEAHRALAPTAPLGEVARANLERWYAEDRAFVHFCREVAPVVNGYEAPGQRRALRSPVQRARTPDGLAARAFVLSLAGVAAFAATAVTAEAFTDRDWSLSGLEWPQDFLTTAALVCLVPIVAAALGFVSNIVRRRAATAGDS